MGRQRAAALAVAAGAAAGVWLLWRVFVVTEPGQRLDDAAFDGSRYGRSRLMTVAEPVLEVVSIPFVALVLLATVLLAVVRRRVLLAVQVAVVMAGANLTTQVLKRVALDRPDLGFDEWYHLNTLPSGHTTAAASVSAALMFVVPRRVRPAAAVLAVLYTAATGISTLVGRWHRPSDAIAAVLVVLAWVGIAVALGVRRPAAARRPRRVPGPAGDSDVTALLLATGALTGLGAAVALQRSIAGMDDGLSGRTELLTAYAGGALGVSAAVCVTFAVVLRLLRLTDAPSDAPRRGETSRAVAAGVRGQPG